MITDRVSPGRVEGVQTMYGPAHAYESAGEIDEQSRLRLDEPLPISGPCRVRVIILVPDDEISEATWLAAATSNPAFSFLNDPVEDVYTLDDGVPVR
jgi:hypothetical protein